MPKAARPRRPQTIPTLIAIGDPTRRDILQLLAARSPMKVIEIERVIRRPQSTISTHLKILRLNGQVTFTAGWRANRYTLTPYAREITIPILNLLPRD